MSKKFTINDFLRNDDQKLP